MRVRLVCYRPVRQRNRYIEKVQRATAGTIPGTGMTIVTNGLTSGRAVMMATDGFMAGTSTTTAITGRTLGESVIKVMSSNPTTTTRPMLGTNVNVMMSGVRVTGNEQLELEPLGDERMGTTQTSAVMIAKDSSGQVIPSSRQ